MYWRELERAAAHQRLGRTIDARPEHMIQVSAPSFPALNVWSADGQVVVTAEIPGVAPDSLEIGVVGKTLTLAGSRPGPALAAGSKFQRRERWYGDFKRTVKLPFPIDLGSASATFANGVLQIALKPVPEAAPQKIVVKTA